MLKDTEYTSRGVVSGNGSAYTSILAALQANGLPEILQQVAEGLPLIYIVKPTDDFESSGHNLRTLIESMDRSLEPYGNVPFLRNPMTGRGMFQYVVIPQVPEKMKIRFENERRKQLAKLDDPVEREKIVSRYTKLSKAYPFPLSEVDDQTIGWLESLGVQVYSLRDFTINKSGKIVYDAASLDKLLNQIAGEHQMERITRGARAAETQSKTFTYTDIWPMHEARDWYEKLRGNFKSNELETVSIIFDADKPTQFSLPPIRLPKNMDRSMQRMAAHYVATLLYSHLVYYGAQTVTVNGPKVFYRVLRNVLGWTVTGKPRYEKGMGIITHYLKLKYGRPLRTRSLPSLKDVEYGVVKSHDAEGPYHEFDSDQVRRELIQDTNSQVIGISFTNREILVVSFSGTGNTVKRYPESRPMVISWKPEEFVEEGKLIEALAEAIRTVANEVRDTLEKIFAAWKSDKPILVHAEGVERFDLIARVHASDDLVRALSRAADDVLVCPLERDVQWGALSRYAEPLTLIA